MLKPAEPIGTRVLWPRDLTQRYGISNTTLWRWERARKLPSRDVYLGGEAVGWYLSTIETAEQCAA
jgi:predicted DNA-binding transcriptional regulator AlpA